jgi:hypothetical protein
VWTGKMIKMTGVKEKDLKHSEKLFTFPYHIDGITFIKTMLSWYWSFAEIQHW